MAARPRDLGDFLAQRDADKATKDGRSSLSAAGISASGNRAIGKYIPPDRPYAFFEVEGPAGGSVRAAPDTVSDEWESVASGGGGVLMPQVALDDLVLLHVSYNVGFEVTMTGLAEGDVVVPSLAIEVTQATPEGGLLGTTIHPNLAVYTEAASPEGAAFARGEMAVGTVQGQFVFHNGPGFWVRMWMGGGGGSGGFAGQVTVTHVPFRGFA